MSADLDPELALLIGLSGGFVFAVLTALLTFLANRQLTQTHMVVEIASFRQYWISDLRSAMSAFSSSTVNSDLKHNSMEAMQPNYATVQFLMNRRDPQYFELIQSMDVSTTLSVRLRMSGSDEDGRRIGSELRAATDRYAVICQDVLKRKWEVVKATLGQRRITPRESRQ